MLVYLKFPDRQLLACAGRRICRFREKGLIYLGRWMTLREALEQLCYLKNPPFLAGFPCRVSKVRYLNSVGRPRLGMPPVHQSVEARGQKGSSYGAGQ